MADISNTVTRVTSAATHTGNTNWTDVAGATISNTFFTAGQDYLLIVTGELRGSATGSGYSGRLVHGATPTKFAGSEYKFYVQGANGWMKYAFWTVWTAASGEDVDFQFKLESGSNTVSAQNVVMIAMSLNDFTENTHYYYSEDNTSTASDSNNWSSSNNASVNFTPSGSDDWMVLTASEVVHGTGTNNALESRCNRSDTDFVPESGQRVVSAGAGFEQYTLPTVRVWPSLSNSSHTFTEQFRTRSALDTATRNRSAVFAINLSTCFTENWQVWDATANRLVDTTWTEQDSLSISPTAERDHFVCGCMWLEGNNVWKNDRCQVNGSSIPLGGTDTNQLHETLKGTDEYPAFIICDIIEIASGSGTVDVDAQAETDIADCELSQIVVFSMDSPLAAGGASGPGSYYTLRRSRITGW